MSKTIELDPAKTADLAPSEGDDRNGFWISPFEVPTRIFLHCGSGPNDIRTVRFEYAGGETGDLREELSGPADLVIQVRPGRYTGKILELNFSRPVPVSELSRIGGRLRDEADHFEVKAKKFNYLMIAAILRDWENVVQPLDQH